MAFGVRPRPINVSVPLKKNKPNMDMLSIVSGSSPPAVETLSFLQLADISNGADLDEFKKISTDYGVTKATIAVCIVRLHKNDTSPYRFQVLRVWRMRHGDKDEAEKKDEIDYTMLMVTWSDALDEDIRDKTGYQERKKLHISTRRNSVYTWCISKVTQSDENMLTAAAYDHFKQRPELDPEVVQGLIHFLDAHNELFQGKLAVDRVTGSSGILVVSHCGYTPVVKVGAEVNWDGKPILQDIDIEDQSEKGANALNVNSLRMLLDKSSTPSTSGESIGELGACWVQHLRNQASVKTDSKTATDPKVEPAVKGPGSPP
ncbi:Tetratricopeptide-like helical [Artemisia annua]|uniref:Tetratricopeptide-like helical n=1 Tax=Artemisia annua TaxID=35608 RepID=A0A2U1N7G0_ARTAN|nr:Tetratricopeptide-like helical [Artemisia annua]